MSGALSICVLIPAYNARSFLREALDSVLAQTRPPEQIIVIDDGSTDGTADVALAWQAERGRSITLIRQSNGGQSAARNAGLRAAWTDLVALLDADDLYLPDHLQRLEQGFREAPQSVVCFGDAEEFTASGVTRPSYVAGTRIETVPIERRRGGLRLMTGSAFSSLLWGNYIPTAATMFGRAAALRDPLGGLRGTHRTRADGATRSAAPGSYGCWLDRVGGRVAAQRYRVDARARVD